MEPQRWDEVVELFYAARERTGRERRVLLESRCGDNRSLRIVVEEMLRDDEASASFLNRPLIDALPATAAALGAPVAPTARFGRYEIVAPIGRGGMGEVWAARDTELDRPVAFKFLAPEISFGGEQLLTQEARAASALNHPNIVTVHEVIHHEDNSIIVMELVEGDALRAMCGTPQPWDRVIRIGEQIARALAAAHDADLIHRDIKPENILLRKDGYIKVVDFGLAGRVAVGSIPPGSGPVAGTPRYMSPEQARGDSLSAASDVFSFGLVLYELLTRQHAFPGDSPMDTVEAILTREPPPPSSLNAAIPAALDRLILIMLAKDPAARPTAREIERILGEAALKSAASGESELRYRRLWLALVISLVALSAIAWFVFRRGNPPERSPAAVESSFITVSPLTSYPGLELDPAFSPDGNRLAFAWDGGKPGNLDIYVKTLPDGDPVRFTSDPGDERSPAWSPDGRYIAFIHRGADNEGIFVSGISGRLSHKVADCVQSSSAPYTSRGDLALLKSTSLTWMPDSKSLGFVGEDPESGRKAIYTVPRDSGEPRRLTSPGPAADDNFPAMSPDGRLLAFLRSHHNAAEEILVVPLTGGKSRQLIGDLHDTLGLTWARDGKDLLALTRRDGNPSAWWRISLAGGAVTRVKDLTANASSPSVSPAHNQLAYAERSTDTNIWRLELSHPGGAFFSKWIASTRQDHSPDMSPDGRMIVFISNRSGQDNVWVCDRDGSRARQITSSRGAPVGTPRWSPDSTSIAFDSSLSAKSDIYIVSREGGSLRRLTNDLASDSVPSWSRDGNYIYFRSLRSGQDQIWKMPARGGQPVQITRHGGMDAFESPDGKFLYFTKDRGPGGIWRIPVDGGEEKPVPELANAGYWRYWAMGSHGLYFIAHESAPPYPLKVFDFSTGTVAQLAVMEKEPLWWVPGLSVSPDERSCLYSKLDASGSDIMMLDNFR